MKENKNITMSDIDKIKKELQNKGIKKSFIAKKVGLTSSEFTHLLNGRNKHQKELEEIKRLLNIK